MTSVLNTVKAPAIGTITTAASLFTSIEAATALLQLIAAVFAVVVGIITFVITIKKLKLLNKEKQDANK